MWEKIKQCFTKIMSLPSNKLGEAEGIFISDWNNCNGGERCGDLQEEEILGHNKASEQVFITEYMKVASVFVKENWAEGYCWVHSQIKGNHESLSDQIEI